MEGLLIILMAGFALGCLSGTALSDAVWRENAAEPKRVLHKSRFYKVVELSNPWSWEMLKIHEDESPGYDGGMTGPDDDNNDSEPAECACDEEGPCKFHGERVVKHTPECRCFDLDQPEIDEMRRLDCGPGMLLAMRDKRIAEHESYIEDLERQQASVPERRHPTSAAEHGWAGAYNKGWNDCCDTVAAALQPPTEQPAVPEGYILAPEEWRERMIIIRSLIANAPEDALGSGHSEYCEPWPIRDEVVDSITKLLNNSRARSLSANPLEANDGN